MEILTNQCEEIETPVVEMDEDSEEGVIGSGLFGLTTIGTK